MVFCLFRGSPYLTFNSHSSSSIGCMTTLSNDIPTVGFVLQKGNNQNNNGHQYILSKNDDLVNFLDFNAQSNHWPQPGLRLKVANDDIVSTDIQNFWIRDGGQTKICNFFFNNY